MAAVLFLLLALVALSISSPLPQDGSTAFGVPPQSDLGSEAVLLESGAEEQEKAPGYQHQEMNPADGSYKFGYETDIGVFRVEQRLGSGQLRGITGVRTADGTVVDAYRYSYDGYGYKQEPYTSEQVPEFLRRAVGPDQLPKLIHELQLFPEYFN